jgi:predicted RNase H-like HicB family nuclease
LIPITSASFSVANPRLPNNPNLPSPDVSDQEDNMKYRVVIERDEDGVFIAEVPSLPGCLAEGATREEVIVNVREAMLAYMESLQKHGDPIPPPISEEIVEV